MNLIKIDAYPKSLTLVLIYDSGGTFTITLKNRKDYDWSLHQFKNNKKQSLDDFLVEKARREVVVPFKRTRKWDRTMPI